MSKAPKYAGAVCTRMRRFPAITRAEPKPGICAMDIDNPRAAQCLRLYLGTNGMTHLASRASLGYPAWPDGEDWQSIEVDLPVCSRDERRVNYFLSKVGCRLADPHRHLSLTHVHAICPVGKLEDVHKIMVGYGKGRK